MMAPFGLECTSGASTVQTRLFPVFGMPLKAPTAPPTSDALRETMQVLEGLRVQAHGNGVQQRYGAGAPRRASEACCAIWVAGGARPCMRAAQSRGRPASAR